MSLEPIRIAVVQPRGVPRMPRLCQRCAAEGERGRLKEKPRRLEGFVLSILLGHLLSGILLRAMPDRVPGMFCPSCLAEMEFAASQRRMSGLILLAWVAIGIPLVLQTATRIGSVTGNRSFGVLAGFAGIALWTTGIWGFRKLYGYRPGPWARLLDARQPVRTLRKKKTPAGRVTELEVANPFFARAVLAANRDHAELAWDEFHLAEQERRAREALDEEAVFSRGGG